MKRRLVQRGLLSVACLGLMASAAAAQAPAAPAPAAPAPAAKPAAASKPAAHAAPAAAAPATAPAAPGAVPPELAPWTAPEDESKASAPAPDAAAGTATAAAGTATPPAAGTPAATPDGAATATADAAATSPAAASTAGARKSAPKNRAHSDAAAAALVAPAALEPPQDEPEVLTPVATTPSFDFSIGFGTQLVSHDGLDAFSDDNGVSEFQLGLSAALSELGAAQLTAVARAGFGGTSGTLRNQPTELGTTKLGLGAELRAPAFERLYLFARLMPEAVHVSTELRETSSGVTLGQSQWTFGLDSALGAVLRIAELRPRGLERGLGLFLRLEAGYAWTPEMDVELTPTGGNAPVRTEPLRLGELALSGFSFGGALGLGY